MAEEEDKKTKKVEVDSPTLERLAVDAAQQQANVNHAINIADTGLASQNVNAAKAPMVDSTINPTVNFVDPAALPQQAMNAAIAGQVQQPSWDETRDRNIANMGTPIPQQPIKLGVQTEMYTPEQADAARKYNDGLRSQVQEKGNFVPDYLAGNKTSPSVTAGPTKGGYKSYDPNQFNYLNTSNPTVSPTTRSSMANANGVSLFDMANAETRHLASPNDNTAWQDGKPQGQRPQLNSDAITESNKANMQLFRDSISGRKSPDVFQQSAPLSSQSQSQQIQNGQTTTNSFQQSPSFKDAYGNNMPDRKVYDESGRRLGGVGGGLALAEYEYKANMNLMRDIARKASAPDPIRNYTKEIVGYTDPVITKGRGGSRSQVGGGKPIYQMVAPTGGSPSKNAAEALAAMGGFGAAGTVAGYHQGMANANKTNTDASLAPGLANASNTAHYASANSANANAEKTNVETAQIPANSESTRAEQAARANNLNNPKPDNALAIAQMNNAAKLSELDPGQYPNNLAIVQGRQSSTKQKASMSIEEARKKAAADRKKRQEEIGRF